MATRKVDYGSRDNRGRTSPSTASDCPPEGGQEKQTDCRKAAQTTVRRYGYIGKIVVQELVRMARNCRDPRLAAELEAELADIMDRLACFEIDITEVSELPDEEC